MKKKNAGIILERQMLYLNSLIDIRFLNTEIPQKGPTTFCRHRDEAMTAVVTDKKQQHRQQLGAASFLDFGYTKRHVHTRPNAFNSDKVTGRWEAAVGYLAVLRKKKRKSRMRCEGVSFF